MGEYVCLNCCCSTKKEKATLMFDKDIKKKDGILSVLVLCLF